VPAKGQTGGPPRNERDENRSFLAATVAAFAERLMPGALGKPGARDTGVLNYIDLALAGAFRPAGFLPPRPRRSMPIAPSSQPAW